MSGLVKTRKPKSKLDRYTLFDYINVVLMLLVIFVTLYPVWYVLCISLSSSEAINQGVVNFLPMKFSETAGKIVPGFSFEAYGKILSTPKIPRAYWNTIRYTGVGVVCELLMTIMFAYPLSRRTFIFRKPLMVMVTITMFFSGGLIPTYLIVSSLGLLDSMWGLIIPNLIWTFDLIILKNFFEGIPHELYEAAIVDGASEFRIMTTIFVPLAKPSIAAIALFFIMGNWNSFLIPSIYLTSADKYPLQVVLRDMLMNDTTKVSDIMDDAKFTPEALKNATIFVSILPMLVVYPWLQKFFIKGLTVGAVKG
jgi:putative aldouronate transport system permease protein